MSAMAETLPFFTSGDDELLGAQRRADPLGVQPVWSALGHEVVPHVTETSRQAAGFEILLIGIWLYHRYVADAANRGARIEEFFQLIEQAFAWSVFLEDPEEWKLPGNRGLVARQGDPQVSLSHPILDSPLSSGLWGLYRTAATSAGLLELDTVLRLSDESQRIFDANPGFSDARLLNAIDRVFKNGAIAIKTFHTLRSELASVYRRLPHRSLLRASLIKPAEATGELLYGHRREYDHLNTATGYRRFLSTALKRFPKTTSFDAIRRCEDYISVLDSVFRLLFVHSGKPVEEASRAIRLPLDHLQSAKAAFQQVLSRPSLSATAKKRADMIWHETQTSDAPEFLRSLIRTHHRVCEERRSTYWIILDGNTLRPLVEVAQYPWGANFDDAWINDYYFRTLLALYTELR